jgi:hypothetical protein
MEARFGELLRGARRVTVLTGAGVSAESGEWYVGARGLPCVGNSVHESVLSAAGGCRLTTFRTFVHSSMFGFGKLGTRPRLCHHLQSPREVHNVRMNALPGWSVGERALPHLLVRKV